MPRSILDMLLEEANTPGSGIPGNETPNEPDVLANLLAQGLPQGASAAPEQELINVLASEMGWPEQDVRMRLNGVQNLIQTGDMQTPSLLDGLAQDMGIEPSGLREVIAGSNALANADAAKKDEERDRQARIRWDAVEESKQPVQDLLSSSPEVDSLINNLLEEAKAADSSNDPQAVAAFASKINKMQHDPAARPEERVAAFQIRQPDMAVSMQPDGVLSFSDQGKLKVKDDATRAAVDRFRSKLDTISPDNPIVVGEGSNLVALGAYTKQRGADRAVQTRANLFGPQNSKSAQKIQAKLQSITSIDDPNERYMALARMGPQLAEFNQNRQAEIRQEVFGEFRIFELQEQLAAAEAADRADPRYDEFSGADSPITARLRQQIRTAKNDALAEVDNRFKLDPLVATVNSQSKMVEAMIGRMDKQDSSVQLTDTIDYMSPAELTRVQVGARALFPDKAKNGLGKVELAKIAALDAPFFEKIASMQKPEDFLTAMAIDTDNADKWSKVIATMEADAGGDEWSRDQMMQRYKRIAKSSRNLFSGATLSEKEVSKLGGPVRALYEQYQEERNTGQYTPTQMASRIQSHYIPKAVAAELDYLQTTTMQAADMTTTDLEPTTSHEGVNRLLEEAREREYRLADLMSPNKLKSLQSADATLDRSNPSNLRSTRLLMGAAAAPPSLLLQDPEARRVLAQYIADKRKAAMLSTALIKPVDTYEDVHRTLSVNAIIGR